MTPHIAHHGVHFRLSMDADPQFTLVAQKRWNVGPNSKPADLRRPPCESRTTHTQAKRSKRPRPTHHSVLARFRFDPILLIQRERRLFLSPQHKSVRLLAVQANGGFGSSYRDGHAPRYSVSLRQQACQSSLRSLELVPQLAKLPAPRFSWHRETQRSARAPEAACATPSRGGHSNVLAGLDELKRLVAVILPPFEHQLFQFSNRIAAVRHIQAASAMMVQYALCGEGKEHSPSSDWPPRQAQNRLWDLHAVDNSKLGFCAVTCGGRERWHGGVVGTHGAPRMSSLLALLTAPPVGGGKTGKSRNSVSQSGRGVWVARTRARSLCTAQGCENADRRTDAHNASCYSTFKSRISVFMRRSCAVRPSSSRNIVA